MDSDINCSFCERSSDEVEVIIAAPNKVFICNVCVDLARDIIGHRRMLKSPEKVSLVDPN